MIKKFFKWGLIAFIGLIVLGAIVGGDDEQATETSTEPANEEQVASEQVEAAETKEEPAEEVAEEPAETQTGIGSTLPVGKLEFTVNGTETAQNVGGEWGSNANGTYLIVDTTIKNIGTESATIDSSLFEIKQGEYTYEPDSMATMDANESGNSFFLESVNPNMTISGKIVFDLPAEMVEAEDLILEVADGLFLAESGEILLK